ncbi:TolC family protein [Limnohabitans sp.]|uniref:TolC family protein n=1 Tax=Limnohabitans sp. TaxID=1907725 RepID=UPI00286F7785|nr:TolC family protein [Limnohabitans sp.]
MKIKKVFVFLGGLYLQLCFSAHAQVFSVESFLESILSNHPAVLAARAETQAARFEVVGAWQQMLPELQATTAKPTNRDPKQVTQPKSTLAVEQKLWAGNKLTATVEAAEMAEKSAQAKLNEAKLNIALVAVEALQAFRSAVERLRVNEQTTLRLSRFESLMARRVEAEVSAPIDATLVRSRMLQAQVDQSNAQTAKRVAISRLEQLNLGGPAVAWESLNAQSLGGAINVPLPLDEKQAWDALQSRIDAHPSVVRYSADAQVARARQDVLSADRFPVVYARLERNRYDNTGFSTQDGVTVGYVGMRFTPGAGYASYSQAVAAAERAQSAQQQAESSRREITNQLRQDLEEWRSATARLVDYRSAVKNAALVSESYERQFIVGRLSWQQTLDAVREHGQVSMSLADTEASLWAASYRLRLRSGDYDLLAQGDAR